MEIRALSTNLSSLEDILYGLRDLGSNAITLDQRDCVFSLDRTSVCDALTRLVHVMF
jgi:hypothetical protein